MPFATIAATLVLLVAPIASGNSAMIKDAATNANSATSEETVLSVSPDHKIGFIETKNLHDRKVVEQEVRAFYAETPVLAEIAFCESTFRQLDKNGNVVRGKVDQGDTGVMQINERYHREAALKLGYDIDTFEGNLKYAQWLYNKEGTVPWNSSKPCWAQRI